MPRGDTGYIEASLREWVQREVAFPDPKTLGKCTKIIVRHLNVKREPQGDIASFPVNLREGEEGEIEPLLHKIAEAAQGDADDLQAGVQLYCLYAYYELDRNYSSRKVFRVSTSKEGFERDVTPSEPPTAEGLVSQTMRHLEAVMRNQTVTMSYMFQSQQKELERLASMNEKYMAGQIDLMVLVQDTLDNAHGRRLKEKEAETSLALQENALAALAPLIPVIINRIAGTPILPEEDKSLMLMAGLLENLSEDQQRLILQSLNDSQRAVLGEVIATYEKKKNKYLEGQKKLMSTFKPGAQNQSPLSPSQPQLESSSSPANQLGPPSSPLPQTISLGERVRLPDPGSSDPKIQQLEADGAALSSRFRDMLRATDPKNPSTKEEP